MTEENRDPELESVAAAWSAPSPGKDFHADVLSAYDREFTRAIWWRRWPVFAAATVATALIVAFVAIPHRQGTAKLAQYEPVQQPRFIIISQGEHP